MDARKASFVTGAGLVGVGVLAARSLGPKMHEHCKTMQAEKCGHGGDSEDETSERKCPSKPDCAARMNAEEVK